MKIGPAHSEDQNDPGGTLTSCHLINRVFLFSIEGQTQQKGRR